LNLSAYVIATKPAIREGVFTGRIQGNMMYGEKKARAIKKLARKKGWDLKECYAYSDHHSDLPLLKSVGHPVAVNPDRILARKAHAYNWPIYDWK